MSMQDNLVKVLYGNGDILTQLEHEQRKGETNKIQLNESTLTLPNKSPLNSSDEITVFIGVLDDVNRLYYDGNSQVAQLYDKLLIGDKKTTFKIRVYSQNREYDDEFIKQIIDKDINELMEYVKTRQSSKTLSSIKRINLITDFDKNIDYNLFNLDKISDRKERKRIISLVEYCHSKLNEAFEQKFDIKSNQGVTGKISYIKIPSVVIPKFLLKDIGISDFISRTYDVLYEKSQDETKVENMKVIEKILKGLKDKFISCLVEFKTYIARVRQKLDSMEDTMIRDPQKMNYGFYDLEIIFGLNGDGLINVTKEVHDKISDSKLKICAT